ncbi:MAG: hypothetical protein OEY79_04355 [Anaplasmataceae bacterium]|nr:hypothetical protein [Anaplasmataceae bacterium]
MLKIGTIIENIDKVFLLSEYTTPAEVIEIKTIKFGDQNDMIYILNNDLTILIAEKEGICNISKKIDMDQLGEYFSLEKLDKIITLDRQGEIAPLKRDDWIKDEMYYNKFDTYEGQYIDKINPEKSQSFDYKTISGDKSSIDIEAFDDKIDIYLTIHGKAEDLIYKNI